MSASTDNPKGATNGPEVLSSDYRQQLQSDSRWALSEGSRHFDEKSAVFAALRKMVARLDELNVRYAVVGGMALFRHGFRRFTEDVDILVTKSDLKLIHEKLEGLGYRPPHKQSKHLRDTETGVTIEFLTTGDFPGDGKPKPVSFPDPASVSQPVDSVNYLNLEKLVELKLASGMTGAGRLKDLADVEELIKILRLPADFGERLNPYVRDKYLELWKQSRRRFVALWHDARLKASVKTIGDMIAALTGAAETLETMRRDGVTVDADAARDGRVRLVTDDARVAEKYDMVEEFELWGDDAEDAGH